MIILSFFPFLSLKVQSFGERIVLFVLNVIIFGRLERSLDDDDMFFLPHSVKERAKILWRNGAAVGFYTTNVKGEGHMVSGGCHQFRCWEGGDWRCPAVLGTPLAQVLLGEDLLAQEVYCQLSCCATKPKVWISFSVHVSSQ